LRFFLAGIESRIFDGGGGESFKSSSISHTGEGDRGGRGRATGSLEVELLGDNVRGRLYPLAAPVVFVSGSLLLSFDGAWDWVNAEEGKLAVAPL
jgi:hypothetical protein